MIAVYVQIQQLHDWIKTRALSNACINIAYFATLTP